MSHRITPLNHGQGFTANLVTGALVIFGSGLGMPVSLPPPYVYLLCLSAFRIVLSSR